MKLFSVWMTPLVAAIAVVAAAAAQDAVSPQQVREAAIRNHAKVSSMLRDVENPVQEDQHVISGDGDHVVYDQSRGESDFQQDADHADNHDHYRSMVPAWNDPRAMPSPTTTIESDGHDDGDDQDSLASHTQWGQLAPSTAPCGRGAQSPPANTAPAPAPAPTRQAYRIHIQADGNGLGPFLHQVITALSTILDGTPPRGAGKRPDPSAIAVEEVEEEEEEEPQQKPRETETETVVVLVTEPPSSVHETPRPTPRRSVVPKPIQTTDARQTLTGDAL